MSVDGNVTTYGQRGRMVTRISTPIVTTRGMKEREMLEIASFMADVLSDDPDPYVQVHGARQADELC